MTIVMAVCYESDSAMQGVRLATALRWMGQPVELFLTGSHKKQFKKARAQGITSIRTVFNNGVVEWYDEGFLTVASSVEEIIHFEQWVRDDFDELADPPDHLLLQNRFIEEQEKCA